MDREITLQLGISFEVLAVAIEAAMAEALPLELAGASAPLVGKASLARLPDDGHSLLAAQLEANLASAAGEECRLSGRIDVYAKIAESQVTLRCSLPDAQAGDDQIKDMLGGYLVAAVTAARASGKLIVDDQPSIISRILFTGRAYWAGCSLLAALLVTMAVLSHF